MSSIVVSTDGRPFVTTAEFVRAAMVEWPDAELLMTERGDYSSTVTDVTVRVRPDGDPGYQVMRSSDGKSVQTDGSREQSAYVGWWATQFADSSGLMLVDLQRGLCAHLRPEMTPGQITDNWDQPLPS